MKSKQKIQLKNTNQIEKKCTLCNPQKYLKFSFAYVGYESGSAKKEDIVKFWERMLWLSERRFDEMLFDYKTSKDKWFETLPLSAIKKDVPQKFRADFPYITNEKYYVLRVYPAGSPNGTANPRIIGMVRNTIFYIFFLDWDGKLYKHGR